MKIVAEVNAMTEVQIKNLISANKILMEDVLTNDSFTLQDKKDIAKRLDTLTKQLSFWVDQNNKERFFYDFKKHINWMLKNYS